MTQMISDVDKCRVVPIHVLIGDNRINRKVKIRCPFHPEKTASCTLFPTGGYHCFGCGAHGNTIDFVMKVGGVSFIEAVKEIKTYI